MISPAQSLSTSRLCLIAADLVDVEAPPAGWSTGPAAAKAERLNGVAGLLGRRHLYTGRPDRVGGLRQPLSAVLGRE